MNRLLPATVLLLVAIDTALSAPPDEIRVSSLGSRGVTFSDPWPGTFADNRFDGAVSSAGDVNGDGFADVLLLHLEFVDSQDDRPPDTRQSLYLVFGGSELPESLAPAGLGGRSSLLSWEVNGHPGVRGAAPAGDVDGDGWDDFFVLRPYAGLVPGGGGPVPGLVYLVHGADSLPAEILLDAPPAGVRITRFTSTKDSDTELALSVARGDLNGDGKLDTAFGAGFSDLPAGGTEYPPGRLYVLFGDTPLTGTIDVNEAGSKRPGFILDGSADGVGMGRKVIFPGDMNGDGLEDLAVSSVSLYGWHPSWVYFIFGSGSFPPHLVEDDIALSVAGARFTGTGSAANTGEAMAAPGDLDGDGFAELAVGARGAAVQAGEVHVVRGRRHFDSDLLVADMPESGLGVTLRGEEGNVQGGDAAGCSLAALDFTGDGRLDIAIGAYGASYLQIPRIGKAYVIEGADLAPGRRSLAEVAAGSLAGVVITDEVFRTAREAYTPWLGACVAAAGDVNGDGRGDLLVSAPSEATWGGRGIRTGRVFLVHGQAPGQSELRLERVEPDSAALAGGAELTLIGAGLDETVEVRIGGAIAPVKRAITTARLVVEAPPASAIGPVDIVAARGGDSFTLAGAFRYVERTHAPIEALKLVESGLDTIVRGQRSNFGWSLAFFDLDGDGFGDILSTIGTGGFAVIAGSRQPARDLRLPDFDAGETLAGASVVRASLGSRVTGIGDVNDDGLEDLAVIEGTLVTVVFGGEPLEAETDLVSLAAQGRAVNVLASSPPARHATGAGDIDGDGIGDIFVSVGHNLSPGSFAVHFVRGHRDWPQESFLEDSPRLTSELPEDKIGDSVAAAGDVDGDGLVDVLVGAPGRYYSDDGNGHLLFGGAWPSPKADTIQDLLAQGGAARFDAFKPSDSLGYEVCGPGDTNGDGFPDLALSAEGGGVHFQGESYVVTGGPWLRKSPGGVIVPMAELGDRGFRILGEYPFDYSSKIASAGDFNGDGLRDLLIGAPSLKSQGGKAYVVFGGASGLVRLHDLGPDGVRIEGGGLHRFGLTRTGGSDFNGDGRDDIVIADAPRSNTNASLFIVFGETSPGAFLRGDSNRDGKLQLSDAVHILGYLFLGSDPPACLDAADATDDGKIDLTDAVYVLAHLFLGGSSPPAPFPEIGADATPDALDCKGNQ